MIGSRRAVRLVQCLACRKVSPASAGECKHCKASFPENRVPYKVTPPKSRDEIVEPFISCPQCRRLLRRYRELCPQCGTTITREYADKSIKANATTTQAFVRAEHIDSLKTAAFLLLTIAVSFAIMAKVADSPEFLWMLTIPLVSSFGSLFVIVQWLRRFGSCESNDEDFLAARRKVKSAFWIWSAVIFAQVIGLLALIW